jgi:NADH:ubiquinone reductase (non-electrogenic)
MVAAILNLLIGLLVWATGNTPRPLIKSFIQKLPADVQTQKRGLVVDEFLKVKGAANIWALGDCTATQWAPTAQVASSQGVYLSSVFNSNDFSKGFEYNHLGSLAYIGSDEAIADLPFGVHIGGALTYYFWRSAYLSNLFSIRNKSLVMFDWTKKSFFGRDISRE